MNRTTELWAFLSSAAPGLLLLLVRRKRPVTAAEIGAAFVWSNLVLIWVLAIYDELWVNHDRTCSQLQHLLIKHEPYRLDDEDGGVGGECIHYRPFGE